MYLYITLYIVYSLQTISLASIICIITLCIIKITIGDFQINYFLTKVSKSKVQIENLIYKYQEFNDG